MSGGLTKTKTLSLMLVALMLWHFAGFSLYAQTRATQRLQAAEALRIAPLPKGPGSRFDALLTELKDVVTRAGAKTKAAPEQGFAGIEKLVELKGKLVAENEKNQNYFAEMTDALKQKGISSEILNRQAEFVQKYDAKYAGLMVNLAGIESAHQTATGMWGKLTGQSKTVNWDAVIESTHAFLDANTPQPRKSNFDPHNLPHRSLKADQAIPPKLTREEWDKALATDFADSTDSAKTTKPGNGAQDSSATESKTSQTAATAKSRQSLKPLGTAPPIPADLAETIEVQFTPEIRALADSLGKNPVKTYNWVRNNIEFVPTWGSIQGAQLCMENRAGNAFDTASLLIARLRVSGIPARYQMGTIEVPIEKFKNWAGGFTDANAAASLFASGGIPSVVRRVSQNGAVVSVRMEHIWIKAFVDYSPSGGATNERGDTWVDLDPSFKQHTFLTGIDFEVTVPSNAEAFVSNLNAAATVDQATGSVTNLNAPAIQTFTQQNINQRLSYLQTNLPNATVGEAFGGQAISIQSLRLLAGTSPNRVLARADELTQLPNSLRHKVAFDLGLGTEGSNSVLSYATSLPEVAGKNVLLFYAPASQSDQQLLIDLGSQSSPWPSAINLVPELYIGGQLVSAGNPLQIGSSVVFQMAFSSPTISTPAVVNTMFVGEHAAIGLDLQGVTSQLQAVRQKAQGIADRIQQGNLGGLTSRDVAEATLSSNIISWFAEADFNNGIAERNGIAIVRYPSAGLFQIKQKTSSLFGAPVSVSPEGLRMDIDRDVVVSVSKDGDFQKMARLSFMLGCVGSAMEAGLPVALMSKPNNPVEGIAAIQALELANQQGIPIYHIEASNAPAILPLLQIAASDLAEIQDAINAGLQVIVSKTPVTFNDQGVLGIVIKDPSSGSASFLVSGSTNGAILILTIAILVALIFFAAAPIVAAIGLLLAGLVSVVGTIIFFRAGDTMFAPFFAALAILFMSVAILAALTAIPAFLALFPIALTESLAIVAAGIFAADVITVLLNYFFSSAKMRLRGRNDS